MSDSTGVYILETADGFRVRWGCYLEELRPEHISLFLECPCFKSKNGAIRFAEQVQSFNNSEYDIIMLNKQNLTIDELLKERKKPKL